MSTDKLLWPDWMPLPLQESYSVEPVDRRAKTEMEMGTVFRVQFDTDETRIRCKLIMGELEYAFFEAFHRHMLKQGSSWFDMPVLTSAGVKHHRARFYDVPKFDGIIGVHMTVTFTLDISARQMLSKEDIDALYFLGPDVIFVSCRLHQILHVQIPGVSSIPVDFWGTE